MFSKQFKRNDNYTVLIIINYNPVINKDSVLKIYILYTYILGNT